MWGGDWFVQYGWGTLLGKLMEKAESTSPRGVQGQSRLTELCMERTVLPKEDNSCDLMDSDKSSDYVERLAHKYMRKCTVESSTESESESNNELNSCAAGLRHVVELMQKLSAGCASNAYSCHQWSAAESGFDFPTCWQQLPQISVILQRTFPPITLMGTR
ncbi:uncharacterized protein LOC123369412 isoform X4 [Mauremys mutica]|uniref:uncharacterized protein LOC123369412 isoform X4 n=1 Tax=Mauremys mutica TaxID=74926 RepID=UPI001D15EB02|nr:uncharacterized protein LOC123369412 isoform X4 [Mauremys mutica]